MTDGLEPRWRRHAGTYVGSMTDGRYGHVDLYLTPPSRAAFGEMIARFDDGPEDFLRLPISDYVANWQTAGEIFDLTFVTAVDLGLYSDSVH